MPVANHGHDRHALSVPARQRPDAFDREAVENRAAIKIITDAIRATFSGQTVRHDGQA